MERRSHVPHLEARCGAPSTRLESKRATVSEVCLDLGVSEQTLARRREQALEVPAWRVLTDGVGDAHPQGRRQADGGAPRRIDDSDHKGSPSTRPARLHQMVVQAGPTASAPLKRAASARRSS